MRAYPETTDPKLVAVATERFEKAQVAFDALEAQRIAEEKAARDQERAARLAEAAELERRAAELRLLCDLPASVAMTSA